MEYAPAGIRAQAVMPNGKMLDDFLNYMSKPKHDRGMKHHHDNWEEEHDEEWEEVRAMMAELDYACEEGDEEACEELEEWFEELEKD